MPTFKYIEMITDYHSLLSSILLAWELMVRKCVLFLSLTILFFNAIYTTTSYWLIGGCLMARKSAHHQVYVHDLQWKNVPLSCQADALYLLQDSI